MAAVTLLTRLCWLALCLCIARSTAAHHSFITHYVVDQSFQITGTIAEVRLRNPHSFYFLDVDAGNGQVERWELEAHSIALLRRMGVDAASVATGQKVTVVGMRSRDPAKKVMFANEFHLEGGRSYVMATRPIRSCSARASRYPKRAASSRRPTPRRWRNVSRACGSIARPARTTCSIAAARAPWRSTPQGSRRARRTTR
jgi:hypothetical protein